MLRNQRTGDPLFLVVSFLILALTLAGALSVCSRRAADPVDGVRLLSPGLVPTVYIPRAASPAEREAAEDLARVLRIMGAAEVEVRPEPWFSGQPGIYVGDTQMARERLPDVVAPSPSLDANGECNPFTSLETRRGPIPPERWDTLGIHAGDGVLVLAGPDPEASALAVYHFLQRHGGVRWWIPGPLGESIPRRELWFVPGMDQRVRPSFLSRSFSGVPGSGGEGRLWARRNLLREHASFSHNLQKLLPGSHAAERPDLFPLVDGRRPEAGVVPAMNLHPDLSNPQVAAEVAAAAGRFFDARPDAASFSLSPGDHLGFGDLEQYGALVDTRTGFRGMADLSPLIFSFYNDVARRVARRYPDRLLGGLSYYAWENVPPFPVEPNVLPYLTADRSQWYDPEFKRSDLDLVSRWAAAGPRHIGTWDYIYGREFIVPRVELAVIKESIPALYERGVRFYFAELNPVWGFDAPKAWIAARLLWDAHADPEALEREFFLGFYGQSSYSMRGFFHRCDSVWMAQPPPARWIKYYKDPDHGVLFPAPLVAELRAQVMRANAEAGSEAVRDRVQLTVDALDATKALSVLLPLQYAVARWAPGQPPAALLDLVEPYRAARLRLQAALEKRDGQPAVDHWALADDPLPGRLALLRPQLSPSERLRLARQLGRDSAESFAISFPSTPLLGEAFATGLEGWSQIRWPSIGTVVEPLPKGVRVQDARMLRLHRQLHVTPGGPFYVALPCTGRVSPASSVRLSVLFLDDQGRLLDTRSDRMPPGETRQGVLCVAGHVPPEARWSMIYVDVSRQEAGDVVILGE